MKKLFYIFSLIAAAALVTLSCQKEEENINPADNPADAADCYGVYFPVQEASGDHIFNPTEAKKVTVKVARTNTEGAIIVPVTATFSADNVFQVSQVTFNDGQAETTFDVTFDAAEDGKKYEAHFVIEDTKYASIYSTNKIGLDFSVMCVEMLKMKTEDGKADAKVTFTVQNDFLGDFGFEEKSWEYNGSIEYYEVDGVRYGSVNVENEGGVWGAGAVIKFAWYPNVKYEYNDNVYQPVEIFVGNTGYELDGSEVGQDHPCAVLFSDYYHHYADIKSNDLGSYLDFVSNYGQSYKLSYYDGHGGFYFNLVYDIEGTSYWYGFCDGSVVGIAEGYVRVDYKLKYETDYCANGAIPLTLGTGADVKNVLIAPVEGNLTPTQISNVLAALKKDGENVICVPTDEFVLDEALGLYVGEYDIKLEKTGQYTFVLAALDEKDEIQNTDSFVAEFVAAEDEEANAVILNVGVEETSDRYAAQGYDATNSFAYWISGKDLTDVHVAIVPADKLTAAVLETIKYKDDYAVSADVLAQIQQPGGYVSLATNRNALTEYYVVVWATNGKLDDYFAASYTTDGLPLEEVGLGTYTYAAWWEGADDEQMLMLDPNYENTYVLTNWGGGVDFRFTVDKDNIITFPYFAIGASHSTYGTVYYFDPFDYYTDSALAADETKAVHSYYDPDEKIYHFHFVLAVSAGSFGHFWESFQLNKDIPAATVAPLKTNVWSSVAKTGMKSNLFAPIVVERHPQPVKATVTPVNSTRSEAKTPVRKGITKADSKF